MIPLLALAIGLIGLEPSDQLRPTSHFAIVQATRTPALPPSSLRSAGMARLGFYIFDWTALVSNVLSPPPEELLRQMEATISFNARLIEGLNLNPDPVGVRVTLPRTGAERMRRVLEIGQGWDRQVQSLLDGDEAQLSYKLGTAVGIASLNLLGLFQSVSLGEDSNDLRRQAALSLQSVSFLSGVVLGLSKLSSESGEFVTQLEKGRTSDAVLKLYAALGSWFRNVEQILRTSVSVAPKADLTADKMSVASAPYPKYKAATLGNSIFEWTFLFGISAAKIADVTTGLFETVEGIIAANAVLMGITLTPEPLGLHLITLRESREAWTESVKIAFSWSGQAEKMLDGTIAATAFSVGNLTGAAKLQALMIALTRSPVNRSSIRNLNAAMQLLARSSESLLPQRSAHLRKLDIIIQQAAQISSTEEAAIVYRDLGNWFDDVQEYLRDSKE